MKIKKLLLLTIFLFGLSFNLVAQRSILRFASIGEPPSLDQQVITSDLGTTIAQNIFEGLYTFNASYDPVPLLASGEKISKDGKVIDISLRKNVPFHNGKEMTSKDVVASLKRWGEFGSRGKILFANVKSVTERGKYGVRITFTQPFGPWKNLLAFINGGPVIYPSEIASKAGKKPIAIKDYIGTGPYKMGSWRANRFLEINKFDDYASPKGRSNGYAGARNAIFERIRFIPVSDAGTRVSGVQSGDFDYAEQIPGDLYDGLKSDPSVKVVVNQGAIFGLIFMNSKNGLFKNNFPLRQAVLTAVDMRPALKAAIGNPALWKANSSFMPSTTSWYSTEGKNLYSQGDAKKARSMAQKAGYRGQEINFMVSKNYIHHYDTAVVMTKQLKEAGFNVKLNVYDWATLISKRGDPSQWDMFFTHHGFVPDPILLSLMNDNYPGWWETSQKENLEKTFVDTTDQRKRKQTWDKFQELIYQQVPAMKSGDIFTYNIASPRLQGIKDTSLIWPKFWGVSKK